MKQTDSKAFAEQLKKTFKVYEHTADNEVISTYFDACSAYPLELVIAGIRQTERTCRFYPKPVDIIDSIKVIVGQNEEQLKARAHTVFKEITRNISIGCDYVFEDARAASAFKQAFGSIVEYGKKTEEDTWLEKRFVEAYASPYLENTGNILGGLYAYTDDPMVRFVGDYDRCLEIVNTSENYQGKHPRLPEDPRKIIKIEYKGDNSPTISKDEFERGMRQIFETCGIVRG